MPDQTTEVHDMETEGTTAAHGDTRSSIETEETTASVAQTPGTTEEPEKKGNPEAAKWRVKLRETEAERDALISRVREMQRAEVVRQASERLVDGDDVFRSVELADVLDEDGNVDGEKVATALEELTTEKPHLGRQQFGGDVGIGERNPSAGATWADVIRG